MAHNSLNPQAMASDNVEYLLNSEDSKDSPVLVSREPPCPEQCNYDDRVVIFQVEDVPFKVHPHLLVRDSTEFRSKVEDHLAKFTKETPIKLEGVTPAEFGYVLEFYHDGMYDDYDPPLSVWIFFLSFSTRFQFPRLYARAVSEIDSGPYNHELHPIDKIVLAQKYSIPEWLVPCYMALCQRERGLDDEEATKIGIQTTNHIWQAREEVRKPPDWGQLVPAQEENIWKVKRYDEHNVSRIVHEVFGLVFNPPPQRKITRKKGKR